MSTPELTAYPFTPADPPTVSDFETALGVIAYVEKLRDVMAAGYGYNVRVRMGSAPDRLAAASSQLRMLAPFLAVPDADDYEDEDRAEDQDEAEDEAVPA